MVMKVYVVVGENDSYEWNVAAFSDKETAELYALMASEESIRIHTHNKAIQRKSWELFPYTVHPAIRDYVKGPTPPDVVKKCADVANQRNQWYKDNSIGPNKYDPKESDAAYYVDELELDGDIPE
jgi:hypothetical protein